MIGLSLRLSRRRVNHVLIKDIGLRREHLTLNRKGTIESIA